MSDAQEWKATAQELRDIDAIKRLKARHCHLVDYRERFRRIEGQWRIGSIHFEFRCRAPFEDGWAQTWIWEIPT